MTVLQLKAHGLEWQVTLDDWECNLSEASLCSASVCAQLKTMSYADAVRLHSALIQIGENMQRANGDLEALAAVLAAFPEQAGLIEENARRAALHGWPKMPAHSHHVALSAL